jgi:hypothetical protein
VVNGSCSGVGCCEVEIPDGLKDIKVEARSFYNHTNISYFNPCGYAFVVEKGEFNFSSDYLHNLPNEKVPLVFDWAVGNLTCEEAGNKPKFACQENSECLDPQNRGVTAASASRVTKGTHTSMGVAKVRIILLQSFPIEMVKHK